MSVVLLVVVLVAVVTYPVLELWFYYDDPRHYGKSLSDAIDHILHSKRRAWVDDSRCPKCGRSDVKTLDRGFAFIRARLTHNLKFGCSTCRIRWRQGGRRWEGSTQ